MNYQLFVREGVEEELAALPSKVKERVLGKIRALAEDPQPAGARVLSGELRGFRRVRVGAYRIGYRIEEAAGKVVVWSVGPRRDFYKRLARKR